MSIKYQVTRAENVERNLKDIAFFIAQDNPTRAISFVRELMNNAEDNLSTFPLKFRQYKDARMYPYRGYLIFYDVQETAKTVEILLVAHASQYLKYAKYFE